MKKESELEKFRSWEARRGDGEPSGSESSGEDDDGRILNTVQVQSATGAKGGSKGGQRKGSNKPKSSSASKRFVALVAGSGRSVAGSVRSAAVADVFDDIFDDSAGSTATGKSSPRMTRGGIPIDPSEAADYWKARLSVENILNGTKLGRERHQAQT